MNVHQKTVDVAAAQQNLDLAVIGNGRTVALVNPLGAHRVVVLSALRRRSGVLPAARGRRREGLHRRSCSTASSSSHSEYVRNTALVTTVLTDQRRRLRCASPISRRASSSSAARSVRRS